jgi:uncharacterized alkaline shock family protein YloU
MAVETMTGLTVANVNVHIVGVSMKKNNAGAEVSADVDED